MMTSAFITSFSHSIFHGRTVSQTTNTQCPMSKRNLTFQPCRKCLVPIFCANQNPEPDSQEEAHSKPKFDPNSEKVWKTLTLLLHGMSTLLIFL